MIRHTYTVATLEIRPKAFDEIASQLRAAGYAHAFMPGGSIDMTGLAIERGKQPKGDARPAPGRFLVFAIDRYEAVVEGPIEDQVSAKRKRAQIGTQLRTGPADHRTAGEPFAFGVDRPDQLFRSGGDCRERREDRCR